MLRFTATGLLLMGLLILILLNPILSYGKKISYTNYTVFTGSEVGREFTARLDRVTGLLKTSELYDKNFKIDICLNDGSVYPGLMEKLRGQAFGWGFLNKVVIAGTVGKQSDAAELNGYKWNLTQLLAHEMVHCLEFYKLGFWHSNPVANFPEWKWEGYPEYIARQNPDQKYLYRNIKRLKTAEAAPNNGWISFDDSTGTVISYYKYWLLVKYCMDIKKVSFKGLLSDTSSQQTVAHEMMYWYAHQQ